MEVTVKFKRLFDDAQLPIQAHPGDAGMDLHAYLPDGPVALVAGQRVLVPCGFAMATGIGWEAQVRPRSGLALKYGISVVNSPGTIDTATYRGPVGVVLINHGAEAFIVQHGDRIAQLVIAKLPKVVFVEVDELDETERGDGGFGSSGSK